MLNIKVRNDFFTYLLLGTCSLAIASFFPFFSSTRFAQGLNDLAARYVYSMSRGQARPHKMVGIVVDQQSLSKMGDRWPWRRGAYAQLITTLDKERVRAVGIDFAFVGRSENPDDDTMLADALRQSSARVCLAYSFNFKKGVPVFPPKEFSAFADLGMINAPSDPDGRIRRLMGEVVIGNRRYLSFSAVLAAAYLKTNPLALLDGLPLQQDRTYAVKYVLKSRDIVRVSFYDALTNMDGLKKKYGGDFLRDALVMVYAENGSPADRYMTPLGIMPTGLIHLNGTVNILSKSFVEESGFFSWLFLLFCFLMVLHVLYRMGFFLGIVFASGVLALSFLGLVFLTMGGSTFNFAHLAGFVGTFFIAGSAYKYAAFFGEILRIKEKATTDPLRGVFTPRYFYNRVALDMQKLYFGREHFLVFISLDPFQRESDDLAWEKVREMWQRISSILQSKGSLWAAYSVNELMGALLCRSSAAPSIAEILQVNLERYFSSLDIRVKPRIAYIKIRRNYPVREVAFILSTELKNRKEPIVFVKDKDVRHLLEFNAVQPSGSDRLLDSFDEDIEDKNRQLLTLIENLNREHTKIKEVFFRIITSLVKALEARDPYTEGHSERVCSYALKLADKMGWNAERKDKLHKAALLHDLGKIGIPDSILHKKTTLTAEEYDFIKKHEIIAVRILEPLKEINDILPWILYHHERWDGKGYPHGLGGDSIPEASQMIALADTFDTLTTGRDYKVSFTVPQAIQELVKNKGTQFNPSLVDLFIEVITDSMRAD